MGYKNLILGVSVITLLLTGCSDYKKLRENVVENNQRVDTILSSYEQSKEVSKDLGKAIVMSLKSRDVNGLLEVPEVKDNQELKEFLAIEVKNLSDTIYDYIESNNEQVDMNENMSKAMRIENPERFIDSVLEVHYFVDDNGKVEQMFLVQLPNGSIGCISIYWLGGAYLESKAFGTC